MDLSKTGRLIAVLRREKGLTQKQVAEKLGVCAKTVSKWETGHGFPDISLVFSLAQIFQIDVSKLFEGEMPEIRPEAGNMKRTKFYVCEKCGNVLTGTGTAEIICCGRHVPVLQPKEADEGHKPEITEIEDDFYITFPHLMTKEHYISFVSYVRFDRVLTVKMYPEQDAEVRFPRMRGGKLYYYCSKEGLFELKI